MRFLVNVSQNSTGQLKGVLLSFYYDSHSFIVRGGI